MRPRVVLGGEEPGEPADDAAPEEPSGFAAVAGEAGSAEARDPLEAKEERKEERPGIEIEVTPAGKATKRLSLLSGGEKSLVALAFLFAVFIARPCPFYILDEVEAALDDRNIDRFLELIRRYSDRSQFIIITHQRRTMEAADVLYGVSMGGDGISKVVSRRLESEPQPREPEERLTEAA
jgi:chromosome segregation protein